MSIVKKHLILHTFENVHCGKGVNRRHYTINDVYPSTVLPNAYHDTTKCYKMLFEKTIYSTIVYVEWRKKRDNKARLNVFK
jgi:hypothetical protein